MEALIIASINLVIRMHPAGDRDWKLQTVPQVNIQPHELSGYTRISGISITLCLQTGDPDFQGIGFN